jgi:hypothetical protein
MPRRVNVLRLQLFTCLIKPFEIRVPRLFIDNMNNCVNYLTIFTSRMGDMYCWLHQKFVMLIITLYRLFENC